MNSPEINNTSSSILSPRRNQNLNYFWVGFTLYSLGITFTTTNFGFNNYKICQLIQIIGLILMATTILGLVQFKFDNLYLRFLYSIYCLWLFSIFFRGSSSLLEYTYLKTFLFDPWYGGMLYFAPLFLIFPKNFVFYRKTVDVIAIFGILYIIFVAVFFSNLFNSDRLNLETRGMVEMFSDLSFTCGFILLTFNYHSRKRQILAITVIALSLLFAIVRARRGLIMMFGTMAIISYLFYFFHSRSKILIIFLSGFFVLLGFNRVNDFHQLYDSRIFGFLLERGVEDTRSGVEVMFYLDMNTKDWIIGRGIDGEYLCPNIEQDKVYRSVIETGYLQTILKGGLISLGLFLLIAIPAIVKGIFYSQNVFSKAAGIWIFLALINLYPSIENTFTLRYILVWICIGICYSDEIRNLSESRIKQFIY